MWSELVGEEKKSDYTTGPNYLGGEPGPTIRQLAVLSNFLGGIFFFQNFKGNSTVLILGDFIAPPGYFPTTPNREDWPHHMLLVPLIIIRHLK